MDYDAVGRSQKRDLLTHFMSTCSAAVFSDVTPIHPLRNPTRDDLGPQHEHGMIGRDKTPAVCRTGSGRHFDVTAFRDSVDFVTQLFVHLKCSLEEWGVGGGEQSDVTSGVVCQSVCTFFFQLQFFELDLRPLV